MKKLLTSLGMLVAGGLMAGQLHAGFTLFDTAKDSNYVARGRYIGLERTNGGDRLTFRCESFIKGSLVETDIVIEPFDRAHHDVAVGQEAIVGFNKSKLDGKFRTSWGIRSIFLAHQNLAACQSALERLQAINAPHQAAIDAELQKRAEFQDPGYEGVYAPALMEAWRGELLYQCSLTGSEAAKSAAQTLLEHNLFKGASSVNELAQYVAPRVKLTPKSSYERAYMIMLISNEPSIFPTMDEAFTMLDQEGQDGFCVGHLAGLMKLMSRPVVISRLTEIITGPTDSVRKANALRVAEGLRDISILPVVHGVMLGQQELGAEADLAVLRGAMDALRAIPHTSNATPLLGFLDSDVCKAETNPNTWWEFSRRGMLAYALIDSQQTNAKVREWYLGAEGGRQQFLRFLIEENKDWRGVVMVFPEKK